MYKLFLDLADEDEMGIKYITEDNFIFLFQRLADAQEKIITAKRAPPPRPAGKARSASDASGKKSSLEQYEEKKFGGYDAEMKDAWTRFY